MEITMHQDTLKYKQVDNIKNSFDVLYRDAIAIKIYDDILQKFNEDVANYRLKCNKLIQATQIKIDDYKRQSNEFYKKLVIIGKKHNFAKHILDDLYSVDLNDDNIIKQINTIAPDILKQYNQSIEKQQLFRNELQVFKEHYEKVYSIDSSNDIKILNFRLSEELEKDIIEHKEVVKNSLIPIKESSPKRLLRIYESILRLTEMHRFFTQNKADFVGQYIKYIGDMNYLQFTKAYNYSWSGEQLTMPKPFEFKKQGGCLKSIWLVIEKIL
jgi:hypothetical protein